MAKVFFFLFFFFFWHLMLAIGPVGHPKSLIDSMLAQEEAAPALRYYKQNSHSCKHQEVKWLFQGSPGGHWPNQHYNSALVQ